MTSCGFSSAAPAKMGAFHPMQTHPIEARDRLIVALDLADIDDAVKMVESLEGVVDFFKIGLSLQLASGVEDFIRSLIEQGKRVFLDYKYYDVPETLKKAVSRAAKYIVSECQSRPVPMLSFRDRQRSLPSYS